jgi:DNA-binding PadR family transcriptional regulator
MEGGIRLAKISKGLMAGSTALMVLHLIEERDMYGYEIVRELEQRSDSVFSLREGTLYPVLHSLEQDGLLQSYVAASEAGKPRKYYRITQKGGKALTDRKAEWALFSWGVNRVIGGLCHE